MAALQKGVDMLKACLKECPEEQKSHVFVILGASVSAVTDSYTISEKYDDKSLDR